MAVQFTDSFATVVSYVEDTEINNGLLRKLAQEIGTFANPNWTLSFPTDPSTIQNLMVLKYTLKEPSPGVGTKDIFVEFYQPVMVQKLSTDETSRVDDVKINYHYMHVVYGYGTYTPPTTVDADGNFTEPGTWELDHASTPARWAWYKADTDSNIKRWVTVSYWISITDDTLQIVLAGDPSGSKTDRIISFGYFGKGKPFKDSKELWSSNFGITVGSDVPPVEYLTIEERYRYNDNTGTGVTDVNMLKTYTGFPMQAHVAAFTTPDEFTEKKLEGPSNYTDKYHMSPVYTFHAYDGYRGELLNVIATDRSSVANKDEMIHKYNLATGTEDNPDTQDIFKVFLFNCPYSILNNSTNILYALAILKQTEPYTP
jgi:hypothetical protein